MHAYSLHIQVDDVYSAFTYSVLINCLEGVVSCVHGHTCTWICKGLLTSVPGFPACSVAMQRNRFLCMAAEAGKPRNKTTGSHPQTHGKLQLKRTFFLPSADSVAPVQPKRIFFDLEFPCNALATHSNGSLLAAVGRKCEYMHACMYVALCPSFLHECHPVKYPYTQISMIMKPVVAFLFFSAMYSIVQ